jgi:hypothetical protein
VRKLNSADADSEHHAWRLPHGSYVFTLGKTRSPARVSRTEHLCSVRLWVY